MSVDAGGVRRQHITRVLRALRLSGRRLVRRGARWGVLSGGDGRRRVRLLLGREDVEQLVREGMIIALDAETYILSGAVAAEPLEVEPWAFVAANMPCKSEKRGFGFAALALQARRGAGPLTLRLVQAGLRLVADAELGADTCRLTMDWDAAPVDRQRRSGGAGGLHGMAWKAACRLRRVRAMTDPVQWSIAWALCVDGQSLRALRRRFGLGHRNAVAAFVAAMEAVANAYER